MIEDLVVLVVLVACLAILAEAGFDLEFLEDPLKAFGRFISILLESGQGELFDSSASAEQWRTNVSLFGTLGDIWIGRVDRVDTFLNKRLLIERDKR